MTEQEIDAQIDAAVDEINERCTPDKMSKQDAVYFLQGVIERLNSCIEALEEEMDDG